MQADLSGTMSAGAQEWVLKQIRERRSERFWFYRPADGAVFSAHLTGAKFYNNELDGEFVFFGLMEPDDKRTFIAAAGCLVAFRSDKTLRVRTQQVEQISSAEGLEIERQIPIDPEFGVAPKLLLGMKVPNTSISLVTARERLWDDLYCVRAREGNVQFVDFPGVDEGGPLPVVERPGEFCHPMNLSTIYVLPDFNGDGSNELLVNSTFTILFDMSKAASGKIEPLRSTLYAAQDARWPNGRSVKPK